MTKSKILNMLALIFSCFGYLEWGGGNHIFLIQTEIDILRTFWTDISTATHPFVLIPFFGQILLLISLFHHQPNKWLNIIGVTCITLLLGFMFCIGLFKYNWKILISTIPFLFVALLIIMHAFRKRPIA